MTLAFWFWLLMVLWVIFGGRVVYTNRAALAPLYWGIGWNFFLFLLLLIIGFALFPDPFGTLVKR
jgi:hypothetical protein